LRFRRVLLGTSSRTRGIVECTQQKLGQQDTENRLAASSYPILLAAPSS
jgi:hypothetical protein